MVRLCEQESGRNKGSEEFLLAQKDVLPRGVYDVIPCLGVTRPERHPRRRRIKTEEKARGRRFFLGDRIDSIPCCAS